MFFIKFNKKVWIFLEFRKGGYPKVYNVISLKRDIHRELWGFNEEYKAIPK